MTKTRRRASSASIDLDDYEIVIANVVYIAGQGFSAGSSITLNTTEVAVLPDGFVSATVVDFGGHWDLTNGTFVASASSVSVELAGFANVTATDVSFAFGENATGPLVALGGITVTSELLPGAAFTVTNLRLERDPRRWKVDALALTLPPDFNERIGVAGILPFRLSTVSVAFENGNASDFTITVNGDFAFDELSIFDDTEFRPVISIGDLQTAADITESMATNPGLPFITAENAGFTFGVRVNDGQFTLVDTGLIVLGFESLRVGPAVLDGLAAIGYYDSEGEFQTDQFGGYFAATFNDGDTAVAFQVAGTSGNGVVSLNGQLTASFQIQDILRRR